MGRFYSSFIFYLHNCPNYFCQICDVFCYQAGVCPHGQLSFILIDYFCWQLIYLSVDISDALRVPWLQWWQEEELEKPKYSCGASLAFTLAVWKALANKARKKDSCLWKILLDMLAPKCAIVRIKFRFEKRELGGSAGPRFFLMLWYDILYSLKPVFLFQI